MRPGLRFFLFASAVLFGSAAAHADSIVLDSMSGNTYTYGLVVNANSSEIFSAGQTITLTGLSGVTGAAVNSFYSGQNLSASSTANSVTLTETSSGGFGNGTPSAFEFSDVFTVTSNSGASGMVSYQVNGTPMVSGMVTGPVASVAATPELSSFVLLGTGLIGAFGMARRRLA